jgi:hypothetical protein
MKELGEYARGIMQGDNFTVKVSVESAARAERLFQQINRMELSKRKAMFVDRSDIDGNAGWSWTIRLHPPEGCSRSAQLMAAAPIS